jgi:RNA-directed DNA polymerase
MLRGHLNDYAVSGDRPSLWQSCNRVRRLWLKSLRRRSQYARLSWERFLQLVDRFFPPIKVLHPLPCHRFDAKAEGGAPCVSGVCRDLGGLCPANACNSAV